MKNPNGYGSVVKLSGNRRKPFAVRKTIGWNEKGHPIYQVIGYTETREEGILLLAQFNNDPWDIDKEKTTLEDLYNLWIEKKGHKLNEKSLSYLRSSFKHTEKIKGMKYKDIKSYHMQEIIDNCGKGYSTQSHIKNLFWHLDRFALEIEIIVKGYSQLVTTEPIPESDKTIFTSDEINSLWEAKEMAWVDSVLIFLYTGFRISELLNMKTEDVNLNEGYFIGGVKTQSGKNRIVPIHSKIFELVQNRYNQENVYFLNFNGKKLYPVKYYELWYEVMKQLDMIHTPHECRHTFRSIIDSAGANKVSINLIMGHKSKDVGERIYTHKTIEELKSAIELVTC
jgi:integrase